jgi:hypothetical protein
MSPDCLSWKAFFDAQWARMECENEAELVLEDRWPLGLGFDTTD